MKAVIRLGTHLRIVAIRQDLYVPSAHATCPMCGAVVSMYRYVRECPITHSWVWPSRSSILAGL